MSQDAPESPRSTRPPRPPAHLLLLGVLALAIGLGAGLFMSLIGSKP